MEKGFLEEIRAVFTRGGEGFRTGEITEGISKSFKANGEGGGFGRKNRSEAWRISIGGTPGDNKLDWRQGCRKRTPKGFFTGDWSFSNV